jgi:hypothetical protein
MLRAVIADRPSAGPETQRAFREAYDRDPTTLPCQPVRWRFVEANTPPDVRGHIGGVVAGDRGAGRSGPGDLRGHAAAKSVCW